MTDLELMAVALEEAQKAAALGEVPVGAVVARRGEIVAAAHNTRETGKNALHHAELLAIDAACKALGIQPCVCIKDTLENYEKSVRLGCRMFTSNDPETAARLLRELGVRDV